MYHIEPYYTSNARIFPYICKMVQYEQISSMSAAKSKVKIVVIVLIIGVGASALAIYAATKDTGQINVNSTISETDQSDFAQQVNANNRATVPNGGLRGKGKNTVAPPPAPEGDVEGAATGTDDGTEEGGDGTADEEVTDENSEQASDEVVAEETQSE